MVLDIIIPTKNRSEFVVKQIENLSAVLSSRPSDLRLTIVDDNSDSSHVNVINSACDSVNGISLLRFNANIGAARARNSGVELNASSDPSDWLWFIDDDDFVDSSSVERVLHAIEQSEENELLALLRCEAEGEIVVPQVRSLFERYRRQGQEVNTSCLVIRRKLFLQIDGWDENLVAGQDTDLFLRAAQVCNQAMLIDGAIVKRTMDSSNRITKSPHKQMKGKWQFMFKHWRTLSKLRLVRYVLTFVLFVPYLKSFVGR